MSMSVNEIAKGWSETKALKEKLSREFRHNATEKALSIPTPPLANHLQQTVETWLRHKVAAEPYWFHRIEFFPDFFTPGWNDPAIEKLPFFRMPDDLTGKRVLDIGCSEGFFSFEAEKRGAREVIAIDSSPDSIRRFNIVREAKQSNATAYLTNVYDLQPSLFGTFDLVLFYRVLYHLKHPQIALERINSVCTGELLLQTHIYEEDAIRGIPWGKYLPHGYMSGKTHETFDYTVFWLFNSACVIAMLDNLGFADIQIVSNDPHPLVFRAHCRNPRPGEPPDRAMAPWS